MSFELFHLHTYYNIVLILAVVVVLAVGSSLNSWLQCDRFCTLIGRCCRFRVLSGWEWRSGHFGSADGRLLAGHASPVPRSPGLRIQYLHWVLQKRTQVHGKYRSSTTVVSFTWSGKDFSRIWTLFWFYFFFYSTFTFFWKSHFLKHFYCLLFTSLFNSVYYQQYSSSTESTTHTAVNIQIISCVDSKSPNSDSDDITSSQTEGGRGLRLQTRGD